MKTLTIKEAQEELHMFIDVCPVELLIDMLKVLYPHANVRPDILIDKITLSDKKEGKNP